MRPPMDRQWPRLTAFLCCYVAAAHRVERAGYTCDTCGVILNYCALGLQLAVHLVHIGATQSHRLVDFHWFQTLSTRNSECKMWLVSSYLFFFKNLSYWFLLIFFFQKPYLFSCFTNFVSCTILLLLPRNINNINKGWLPSRLQAIDFLTETDIFP